MSSARKIRRRMQKDEAVLSLTDPKTLLKRQRDLLLRRQRTEWFFEGLMHACGHATPAPLDAYHRKIETVGTTICAWNS